MGKVVSVHEYELKPGVAAKDFEEAVRAADTRGLFRLPGLVGYHLVRGVKGERRGRYAAMWIYESRAAWERLWGPPDQPRPFEEYPETWRTWEQEVLAPLLVQIPDTISFTTYEVL